MTAEQIAHRLTLVRGRMSPMFARATCGNDQVEAWCDRVAAGQSGNLLLLGSVGSGKSWTAWGCWPQLVGSGWRGTWVACEEGDLHDALRPEGDRELVRRATERDVLMLDDVGAAVASDWTRVRTASLIDKRWQWQRPTIITSNLTAPMLTTHFGERAASRFGHGLTTVTLTGADRRRG